MSNPGPNIVAESAARAEAVVAVSLTPAEVATVVCAEQDFTVTGVAVGDFVQVNPPAIANAVSCVGARVKSANTVTLIFCNPKATGATPASGTYTFHIIRPYPSAQSSFMSGTSVANTGGIPLST